MSKKIHRGLALLIAMILVIGLSACNSDTAIPADNGDSTAPAANDSGDGEAQAPAGDSTSGSGDEIKIGLVYPLTGAAAKTGADYIHAYELAAEIINGSYPDLDLPFAAEEGLPGLGGAKIVYEIADHQASPEVGLAETERLITEKGVVAVIGCHYSAVAKTASNAAERLNIPFLIPDATAKSLTERGFDWVFRSGPHDGTFVEDTFEYLDHLNETQDAGIRTVAIVSEDTEFGALLVEEEEALAPEYGYEIVEKIIYPANSTNLTSEVIKLKSANPDVVIMASYTSDAILFIKTFQEQDFLPKAIIGQRAGFIAPELFSALGDLAEGIATTNIWALDLENANPLVGQINDMYKERSGVDLTGDYARGFTGAFVMADAINRAGSTDPEAIRQALLETNIVNDGQLIVPWVGVEFDPETHQNIHASGIITQVFDGEYKTVYPVDSRSAEPLVPLKPWDDR